jgi:single-strand DNA-binding protein
MGRLARDPETKYTEAGLAITRFTVATDAYKKDDPADFHACTAFNKTAETIAQHLKKGDGILVNGSLKTSKFESDGQVKYRTEVMVQRFEFTPGKGAGGSQPQKKATVDVSSIDVDDSEIPF